jgi:hypothetical protein
MNDNRRPDAAIVQHAIDLKLTLDEIRALIALRPNTYAPLVQLLRRKP